MVQAVLILKQGMHSCAQTGPQGRGVSEDLYLDLCSGLLGIRKMYEPGLLMLIERIEDCSNWRYAAFHDKTWLQRTLKPAGATAMQECSRRASSTEPPLVEPHFE